MSIFTEFFNLNVWQSSEFTSRLLKLFCHVSNMDTLEWLIYAKLIRAFTPNSKQFSLYYGIIIRNTKLKQTKGWQRFKKNYQLFNLIFECHCLQVSSTEVARAILHTHQTSGMYAGVRACYCMHQMEKTGDKQEFKTFPKTCSQGLQTCSH